jgi:ATP-dependent exoDNAse (exonuclease V) alpha subunit
METKQRIYLDENNKLVVNTNKGVVKERESYAIIQGKFTIGANDVAKLLSMINEKNMFAFYPMYGENTKWYIGNANDLTHQLECEVQLRKEKEEESLILNRKNTRLIRKIDDFNETRHCWERKFKIGEEE